MVSKFVEALLVDTAQAGRKEPWSLAAPATWPRVLPVLGQALEEQDEVQELEDIRRRRYYLSILLKY